MARNRITEWQHIHLEGNILSWDIIELISKENAPATDPASYSLPSGMSVMDAAGQAYSNACAYYKDYQDKIRGKDGQDARDITRDFISRILSYCFSWSLETITKLDVGSYSYPIRRMAYGRIPVLTIAGDSSFDKADKLYAITNGQRVISPFNMLQQYLSASGETRWGILASGEKLRLMRSATALSRPEFLEFDLGAILSGDFYNEFVLLYRILHSSRVRDVETGTDLDIWEEWRNTSISDGERVRDRLRDGVQSAIIAFGNGFIHANESLRDDITNGRLSATDYYHELLRLCYRLLFLSVLEERYSPDGMRMIFAPDSTPEARESYEKGYSLFHLRRIMRSTKYRTGSHHDLWEAMLIVFQSLEKGQPLLGLPALGGIFSSSSCPHLDGLYLINRDFLDGIYSLRWSEHDGGLYWIDYRNLGSIELGSVYESLLELVPMIDQTTLEFRFLEGSDEETSAGNKRKTTGSYYTPDFMVDQLIRTALMPVIEDKLKDTSYKTAEDALLSMTVIDPACGSGHFLIAAASAIATRLAAVRDDAGKPEGFRSAFRDVISRCIYGVDINPMAVELTKMSLWIEGYEPGKPLSFLDAHIKCGNSIVGVFDTSVLTEKGIPQDAFKPFDDDDKKYAADLKADNTRGLKSLKTRLRNKDSEDQELFSSEQTEDVITVSNMPEDTIDDIQNKDIEYRKYLQKIADSALNRACDAYIAAFYAPKRTLEDPVPTTFTVLHILDGNVQREDETVIDYVEKLAEENRYFHWPLEFPEVFADGGFDVVLGNPPWDKVKVKDEEFFASRIGSIAKAQNASQRKAMISRLPQGAEYERAVYREYKDLLRFYESQNRFLHVKGDNGEAYPLSGKGDVNLYAVFTELASKLRKETGSVGFVVPTGICTDAGTQYLFGSFVEKNIVQSIYDFENGNTIEITGNGGKVKREQTRIFPAVHASYKFSLLTLRRSDKPDFCFFLHTVKELEDQRRHYPLSSEDIKLINPNTKTLPLIRSEKDYEVLRKIYRNSTVVWDENRDDGNTFDLTFMRMFDMSNDSDLFYTEYAPGRMPLYEGKFISQYDYRFNSYKGDADSKGNPVESLVTSDEKANPDFEITPQYWIDEKEVYFRYSNADDDTKKRYANGSDVIVDDKGQLGLDLSGTSADKNIAEIVKEMTPKWCFGYRAITNVTNTRTVISTIFPLSGVGNSMSVGRSSSLVGIILLSSNLSSLVLDYAARNKIGGTNLNQFYFKQLPVISTKHNGGYSDEEKEYVIRYSKRLLATTKKMAEILSCPVTIWNDDERAVLMARLDAFYAMKYGLERDELEFILDPEAVMGKGYPTQTFPQVKANDIAKFGEYRTKRLVMEAYDELMRDGLWQD